MRYTGKSIAIAIASAVGVGLALGLARIHLGWLASVSDIVFATLIGAIAGAFAPFVLKPKDNAND